MSKESGLGWTTLAVDNSSGTPNDIKNDVTSLDWSVTNAMQEVTGVDKSAIERLALLADFTTTLNGVYDDGSSLSWATLKDLPTGVSRTVTLTVSGQTLTNECLGTSFDFSRSDAGELTWKSTLVLSNGVLPAWS